MGAFNCVYAVNLNKTDLVDQIRQAAANGWPIRNPIQPVPVQEKAARISINKRRCHWPI